MSRALLGRVARLLGYSSPASASTAAAQASFAPARPEGDGAGVAVCATTAASPPGTGDADTAESIRESVETIVGWLLATQAIAGEVDASTSERRIAERASHILRSSISTRRVREVPTVQTMATLVAAGWLALRAIDGRYRGTDRHEVGDIAVSRRVTDTVHACRIAEDLASAIQDRIYAIEQGQRPSDWVTVWAACDTLARYAEFSESISPEAPLRDEALLHAAADWGTR